MTNNKQSNRTINSKAIQKIVDRKVNKLIPAAKHSVVKTTRAKPKLTKDGVLYKHREYIGEITSSPTFTKGFSQLINPGNALMFPWLSTVASSFERYKIHKLHFEYLHQAGTQLSGVVASYIEYDPLDPDPSALGHLLNNYDAVSGAPYDDFRVHYRTKEEQMKNYFIDPAQQIAQYNTTSHPGQLRVYTQNSTAAALCGLLWVDYEIELLVPDTKGMPTDSNIVAFFSSTDSETDAQTFLDALIEMRKKPNYSINPKHDLIERGPLTLYDDIGNRSRVAILAEGTYNDMFSEPANSCVLYFDRPGKYKIDMIYKTDLGPLPEDNVLNDMVFAYNNSGFGPSSAKWESAKESGWIGREFRISLYLVVVDVAVRFGWKAAYAASNALRRPIYAMGLTITDVADEILGEAFLIVNNLLVNGVNPYEKVNHVNGVCYSRSINADTRTRVVKDSNSGSVQLPSLGSQPSSICNLGREEYFRR